jgi:cytidine deaminase
MNHDMTTSLEMLLDAARAVVKNAYAPYSKLKVGAAALFDDGAVITGVNVENASFGLTICAERTALASAISQGNRRLRALAIASSAGAALPPCGACRQVIAEFSDGDTIVVLDGDGGKVETHLISELLPLAFKFPV